MSKMARVDDCTGCPHVSRSSRRCYHPKAMLFDFRPTDNGMTKLKTSRRITDAAWEANRIPDWCPLPDAQTPTVGQQCMAALAEFTEALEADNNGPA